MSIPELFKVKSAGEKAAGRYLEAHVLHNEAYLELRAIGRYAEAEAHHAAGKWALKAHDAEIRGLDAEEGSR